MTQTREIYRDKRGRFVSRMTLWEGPNEPYSRILGRAMEHRADQVLELIMRENPIMGILRERDLIRR